MRITNGTLVRTFLSNLNNNLNKMSKYQQQLSSFSKFSKPSDDPFGVVKSMDINTSLSRNEQYATNIEEATGWLDTTDTALESINNTLGRIKDLVSSAANGTNSETERNAIKVEVEQRIQELAQYGNTVFDGRYILGGNQTTEPPFDVEDGTLVYNVDRSKESNIYREISPNVIISINVSGNRITDYETELSGGTKVKTNDLLDKVLVALDNQDSEALSGDLLKGLQDNINNILALRAEVGAKQNRMESANGKNEEDNYNLTSLLSQNQDVDIGEMTIKNKTAEVVYEACLAAGAKIIQPSLVDYLR